MTPAELPLPIPLAVAKAMLVAAFLLHIVFVNLMVGGTWIALVAHWRGREDPVMLDLAHRLISTVTVHKSLAVVLGVAPLLLISVAYTTPFYTSSLLIAPAWLSVLWLVTLAFLLLYAYKYGFEGWHARNPAVHAATGVLGGLCLLAIPLIYLTNTQLMLDAAAMARRPGFFEAMLTVGNVFPRYAHFMLASLAVTGFWVALWWGRAGSPLEGAAKDRVVRFGARWALIPTALQFIAGPVVLFTLPAGGLTGPVALFLALGVVFGLGAIFLIADTLRGTPRMGIAAGLLAVTVCCMGVSRHLIREALLARPVPAAKLPGDAWGPGPTVATIAPGVARAAAPGGRDGEGRGEDGDDRHQALDPAQAHSRGAVPRP